jgi:hypothetical protein
LSHGGFPEKVELESKAENAEAEKIVQGEYHVILTLYSVLQGTDIAKRQ